MHGTHTYRLLTRERSLPTPQMCAEACAARAGAQHTTRKHGRPRTHARVRGSKSLHATIHRREPRRAHQHRNPWTKRAHQVLFGTADRDRAMILPMKSTKTAIRVDGEDVGGSLQHAPSMDSMSAPASTAPMNFSATSSASQPSPRTPKQRRHGGQRDEDPSSQRPDPAFKRPFLPHSPPSLSLDFGQGRTTRCKLRKYIQHITYKCRVHTWAYHAARGSDQAHAVTRCNDFPS